MNSKDLAKQVFDAEVVASAEAMAMPAATPSKVYAVFKLLRYGVVNKNGDCFRKEDVDDAWKTIRGSDINFMHTNKVLGTVLEAESTDEGIVCLGALKRSALKSVGIDPENLPETATASMECKFIWGTTKFQVGDQEVGFEEAKASGIAFDRTKYEARYITPIEFDACALCIRGTEADKGANYMAVSATTEEVEAETAVAQEGAVEPNDSNGGATMTELEKFQAEVLPGLLEEAKAAGRAEAEATVTEKVEAAKAEALAEIDAKIAEAKSAAVEEFKSAEAKFSGRFDELNSILAYSEEEKAEAIASVREMDELAFANAKADRALKALEAAKAQAATATATATETAPVVPVTLRAEETEGKTFAFWVAPEQK